MASTTTTARALHAVTSVTWRSGWQIQT